MSEAMPKEDFNAACNALVNWFRSQDISVPDAITIMVALIAHFLGRRGKDEGAVMSHVANTSCALAQLSLLAFEDKASDKQ